MADREIAESEISQLILDTIDGNLARKMLEVANEYHHGLDEAGDDIKTTLACMAIIVGLCRNDELGVRLLEEIYEIREVWITEQEEVKH